MPVDTPVAPKKQSKPTPKRPKRRPLKQWHVVLLDDDQHTYEYVILMLGRVCGHPILRAAKMAREVDTKGRSIVFTGHRELAELKLELIRGFGGDVRIATCKGSMSAVLEPAR
jgi:ATP-dependent Clp protease adaptor protein ClpS